MFDDTFGVSDEDGRTEQEFQQLATPSGKGKAGQCSPRDNVSDVSSLSPDRSPPSSPLARKSAEKKGQRSRADLRRMSMDQSAEDDDEIIELPSVPRRRDSRAETIASVSPVADSPSPQAIVAKSSDVSLSSAESSDTIIRSKVRDGPVEPVNASHSAFPTPPQISPSRSPGTPLRPSEKPSSDSLSPGSSSSFPTPAQRISSIPTYGTLQSAVRVQYPTLRPSSFSGSWAESSFTTRLSKRPVRMGEPSTFERWNPHLSTVQSEPTEDRSSESPPPAESPVGRESSSSIPGRPAPLSSHPLSPPQPAFVRQRDGTGSTIRMVGDGDDDDDGDNMTALPEVLPSPPPRSRGSGFLSGFSRDSRRYSASQAGPGQRGSLFRDSIPVWARYIKRSDSQRSSRPQTNHEQNTNHDERVYYSRGARNSLLVQSPEPDPEVAGSRPQSELSPISPIFPRNLFNPRRRPREIDTTRNRDSMAITPVQVTNGEELVEIRGQPRSKYGGTWSPHLWHDRKSVANRRSMFIEPTLPVKDEGLELNKRSAQIVLFAIGFIFPLGKFSPALQDPIG